MNIELKHLLRISYSKLLTVSLTYACQKGFFQRVLTHPILMRSKMSEQLKLPEEQQSAWVRDQYQKATKYLAEKGLVTENVAPKDSRYLVPIVAVWKLNTLSDGAVWVISGDLPCDHIATSAADSVREALRNFSMKWQLQAQNIENSATDKTQLDFAKLLVSRAEGLYQLFDDEKLWSEG